MNDDERWQISGVSPQARDLARATARSQGLGVGDWLDRVIRARTGLDGATIPVDDDTLSQGLAESLDALEARIADQASGVEALVAPIAEELDTLDDRVRSVADTLPDEDPADAPVGDTATEHTSAEAPFYAAGDSPAEGDRNIADATVAADLGQLFDDGTHAGEGGRPAEPLPPQNPLHRRESGSRRGMLVAAAIVIVLIATGITFYQWTRVDSLPDEPVAPPRAEAPAPVAPPAPPTTAATPPAAAGEPAQARPESTPALPAETVDLETLPARDTASTNGKDAAPDPSFTRPPAPQAGDDSPITALYRGAAAGDRRAQYDLAVFYIQGQGVPQDYAAAAYWLREAATAGLALAQYNLGVMYDLGLAGRRDPVEALLWFHAAADQQQPRAYYALGIAYAEGKGVPRNQESARLWFTKGAEAGVADAQFALGVMYEQGIGGPASTEQAYYWLRRAEISGNDRAADRLADLAGKLTDSQRATLNDRVSRDATPGLVRPATAASPGPAPAPAAAAPAAPAAPAAASQPAPVSKATVRSIQQVLTTLGFDPGPADGDAGPRTRTAIEEYQRALGLPVDGRPSTTLLDHLRDVAGLSDER